MLEFKSLDRQMRTFALVGKFLFEWAYMETRLREALQKALNLEQMQAVIVASNIQLRDKIHILRSAVFVSTNLLENDRNHFDQVLKDIANYSPKRNMVAHDAFVQDNSGDGVSFLVIKAKGKLNIPDMDWSIADFEEAYTTISGFAKELIKMSSALDAGALAAALMKKSAGSPIGGLFGLGGTGLLNLPLPEHQDSDTDPANQKKEPQTPSKSGE